MTTNNRSQDMQGGGVPQWAYIVLFLVVVAGMLLLPVALAQVMLAVLAGLSVTAAGVTAGRAWGRWAAPRTEWHARLRWGGVLAALAVAGVLHPSFDGTLWPLAAGLFVGGAVLVAPVIPAPQRFAVVLKKRRTFSAFDWGALAVGVGLFVVLALRGTRRFGGALGFLDMGMQVAMLWAGAVALIVGAGALRLRDVRPRPLNRTAWAIFGLMAVAFVLRTVRLGSHMTYMPDEWVFASAAGRILPELHPGLTAQVDTFAASTWVFIVWQRGLSALVGGGLFGLRFTSAVVGTLTVGAVGWAVYELLDRRQTTTRRPVFPLAVTAAAALACLPSHIHYSRLALYNIMDPLVGLVALAALARGLRTGSRVALSAGGVALGLTQYFYEAGRLLFIPVFGVWLAVELWQARGRNWRGAAGVVALAVVVGAGPWLPGRGCRLWSIAAQRRSGWRRPASPGTLTSCIFHWLCATCVTCRKRR